MTTVIIFDLFTKIHNQDVIKSIYDLMYELELFEFLREEEIL